MALATRASVSRGRVTCGHRCTSWSVINCCSLISIRPGFAVVRILTSTVSNKPVSSSTTSLHPVRYPGSTPILRPRTGGSIGKHPNCGRKRVWRSPAVSVNWRRSSRSIAGASKRQHRLLWREEGAYCKSRLRTRLFSITAKTASTGPAGYFLHFFSRFRSIASTA